jgi:maleylacetoacetate isomerase
MACSSSKVILFSSWRSSASWRVRAVLAFKGIEYEYRPVDLYNGEQRKSDFLTNVNPMSQVPALFIDDVTLTQSVAIMEYLEETRRDGSATRLLPDDAKKRAQVRAIVELINSGIQPLQNTSVQNKVGTERKGEWAAHWVDAGFKALEALLSRSAGVYCVGDSVTLADCCLVPQCYAARRFGVGVTAATFANIHRIEQKLLELDAFRASHPDKQPDCPTE